MPFCLEELPLQHWLGTGAPASAGPTREAHADSAARLRDATSRPAVLYQESAGSSSAASARSLPFPGNQVTVPILMALPGYELATCQVEMSLPTDPEALVGFIHDAAPPPLDVCWSRIVPTNPQLSSRFFSVVVTAA